MQRKVSIVLLISLASSFAFAESRTAPEPGPSTAELIARLGSEDFHEREAAVAELVQAGPGVLPAVRDALKSENPEVRRRAAEVEKKLRRVVIANELLAPKMLTLNYQDTPLGNAINDFRTRSGLNIHIDAARIGDPLRKVTCIAGELPLWEALDAFSAAAGLVEDFTNELELPKAQNQGRGYFVQMPQTPLPEEVPITLVAGKHVKLPGDRRTAVRVSVLPASFHGHRVTLGTGETTLSFEITPTPGINWQEVIGVSITRLIDDAGRLGRGLPFRKEPQDMDSEYPLVFCGPRIAMGGRALVLDSWAGRSTMPETVANPRIIPINLKLATPAARRIKRLEGEIIGTLTLPDQTLIEIDDPMNRLGKTFIAPDGQRLTLSSEADPERKHDTRLRLTLIYPAPWLESARRGRNPGGIWPEVPDTATTLPTPHAFDATGKPLHPLNSTSYVTPSDDGRTVIQNHFWTFRGEDGLPAQIRVTGSRLVVVRIPFALDNVPLP